MSGREGLMTRLWIGDKREPEVEIHEGEFIGLSFHQSRGPTITRLDDLAALTFRCVDSTLWECETDDAVVVAAIRREFRDVQDPPS